MKSRALFVAVALLAGCTAPQPPVPERSKAAEVHDLAGVGDSYFPLYGNAGYDVASYLLKIKYDPASKILTGTTTITATATAALKRFHLDLHGLEVESVTVDGAKATVGPREDDELVITPASPLASQAKFTTVITYSGEPKLFSSQVLGKKGFFTQDGGAFVMGQPESASTWFPVNDHPRDKATYAIEITAPERLSAISNGVLAGKTAKDGWTTWKWNVTSPMAPYLATLAIGDYRVKESTFRGKQVITAVASSHPVGVMDQDIARTTEVVEYLEQFFGPYPFDSYGGIIVDDPRIGFALETQTRPIYSPKFWSRGSNTVVVAHELAHQWFGDSVAIDEWRHIWLNEGFATYGQWLWGEHIGQDTVQKQFDTRYNDPNSKLWAVAPGSPGGGAAVFNASVYQRGGMALHALRKEVGDEKFFTILKTWAAEQRDGNATTDEFIELAERVSGKQLDTLFDQWLFRTEKPAL